MPRPAPSLTYRADANHQLCWPLGGIGAPLLGLTAAGGLERIANRHRPDLRGVSPCFAAVSFPGRPDRARVLEGPVPRYKSWTNGLSPRGHMQSCGFGNGGGNHFGLPRLHDAVFTHRFPLAEVALGEKGWPLAVELTAWSPFIPGDADASGQPVAALTYRLRNPGSKRCRAMFSFHCHLDLLRERETPIGGERIRRTAQGFAIDYPAHADRPWSVGGLAVELDGALADCAWFRGGWFDAISALWRAIADASATERAPHAEGAAGHGGSLWLPIDIPAGGEIAVTVRLAWHEPVSNQRHGPKELVPGEIAPGTYRPAYATRFSDVDAVATAFRASYADDEQRTRAFAEALHATDVPAEILEAVTANLGILRSPTVMRQHDGRLWAWEGSGELEGSCMGSCTHVWNYAQALPHLFPDLERALRQTEFTESQDEHGHQNFRSALPIRPTDHGFHAAADGQFGGIVKVWREWQISGDTAWLRELWPRVRASLEYAIGAWDPDRTGALIEPHHNTYDIEFWGPDGMCGSFYAAALKAAAALAEAVDEDPAPWRDLLAKAVQHLERDLFRGGRFVQQVMRATPRSGDAARQKPTWTVNYSPEALALLDAEGPKYQYGNGCLSDGVLGAWLAEVSGLGSPLAAAKVRSHLAQIHRHNLKRDLRSHANPQRATFAIGDEGGLLLCTWPDGGKPTLPFVYSDEVWTGIEYQVASHCILAGLVEEGLEIVRIARARYRSGRRNPFDEYECGHWYARALSSWALLQAYSGVRYSAVERTLWIAPRAAKRPFRAFLGVGGNFGTVTLGKGTVTVALAAGELAIDHVVVDRKTTRWGVVATAAEPARLALRGSR